MDGVTVSFKIVEYTTTHKSVVVTIRFVNHDTGFVHEYPQLIPLNRFQSEYSSIMWHMIQESEKAFKDAFFLTATDTDTDKEKPSA